MSHTAHTPANVASLDEAVEIAGQLHDKFIAEYGTTIRPRIQTRLYGRHSYIGDEEEMAKFEQAGGHGDSERSCCNLVGLTTRWAMDIVMG